MDAAQSGRAKRPGIIATIVGGIFAIVCAFVGGVGTGVVQNETASRLTSQFLQGLSPSDLSSASFVLPYNNGPVLTWPTTFGVGGTLTLAPKPATRYWYVQRKVGESGWHLATAPCDAIDLVVQCNALYLGEETSKPANYELEFWRAAGPASRKLQKFADLHPSDRATLQRPAGVEETDHILVSQSS